MDVWQLIEETRKILKELGKLFMDTENGMQKN